MLRVSFKYENEPYHIEIDDVAVFQCYAAVWTRFLLVAKKTLIVDIGSWTIDIMPVIKFRMNQSVTIPKRSYCMRSINEQCVRQLNGEVDESGRYRTSCDMAGQILMMNTLPLLRQR